jgi:hypothetical protein
MTDGDKLHQHLMLEWLYNVLKLLRCGVPQAHAKGSSLMQPLRPKSTAPSAAALGSAMFDALAQADVAPDAAFFQKYQVRCAAQT